jgi:NAD(P)H-hydrate epimerase
MVSISREMAGKIDDHLIGAIGIPRDILIEHAAFAVMKKCISYFEKQNRNYSTYPIHVFAGKGMNGLDAFACARHLTAIGCHVNVWQVFPDAETKRPWQVETDKNLGIRIRPAKEYRPDEDGLIVDGIFGTAFTISRDFPASLRNLFHRINTAHGNGCHVIAIDLPSGVEADTGKASTSTILADETVTFILPKTGIMLYPGRKYAGKIHIDRIGLSRQFIEKTLAAVSEKTDILPLLLEESSVGKWLMKRPEDGHKGTFGSAGLIGGSKGMAGSICLSAMASMRCGVGLTYMCVPEKMEADCLAVVPEALISQDYRIVFEKSDAIAIGPGMDKTTRSVLALWTAIESVPSLVLDAGALNILALHPQEAVGCLRKRAEKQLPWLIMTPHPGEFARLMPDLAALDRLTAARTAAEHFGAIVVLKGAGTVISDPEGRIFINTSGNSGMAKGGSGDVLSGMMVSFLAQGQPPLQAAALAVCFHGVCGDLAAFEMGERAVLPSDFIRKIPEAFHLLEEKQNEERTEYG